MTKETVENTLEEISVAIREIDSKRLSDNLSKEEREILELSAFALREAERVAIEKLQKEFLNDIKYATNSLKLLAAEIRQRVTRMNALPKKIDALETILKQITGILNIALKW